MRQRAALAAIFAVVFGLWLAGAWPFHPPVAAMVVEGAALLANGRPVEGGAAIRTGDRLEVGKLGFAELEIPGRGWLRAFGDTDLSFEDRGRTAVVERGTAWCELNRGHPPYRMRTDTAIAAAHGTSFAVERRDDGATEVRVSEGSVEVQDRKGKGKALLAEGQKTRVERDGAPSAPAPCDRAQDRVAWEKQLRRLGRELERAARTVEERAPKVEREVRREVEKAVEAVKKKLE